MSSLKELYGLIIRKTRTEQKNKREYKTWKRDT